MYSTNIDGEAMQVGIPPIHDAVEGEIWRHGEKGSVPGRFH